MPTPLSAVSRVIRRSQRSAPGQNGDAESHALRLYAQFVRAGSLCFDVGANVGERTATFLNLGARVVAIEPQVPCVAELERCFGDAISVVDAAVGAREGKGELFVADYSTLSSMNY